ncbi:MAG: hypothetical protein ACYTGM_20845 [Planctomycetota bacterium]|jgi:hypothetical protein
MLFRIQWALAGCALVLASPARGEVLEFVDKGDWFAAVGDVTTIDFTGFPAGTVITDQYADLGVHFVDANDRYFTTPSFVNDNWGVDGNGDITLAFDTPQAYIAAEFPGFLRIELFSSGQSIYLSSLFFGDPVGNFAGLLTDQPFDMAVLMDDPSSSEAEIDDLHFGIPAPPTVVAFALAALSPRRRRRFPAS